ncbi:MAG: hypothetical protein ACI4I9_10570 [Porcipelethomonas sp.]
MKTNNEQGRMAALVVGVYFVAKSVLNLILGGGFTEIIIAIVEAALLFTGLMYVNYVVAAVTALIVLKYLKNNLSNPLDNIIYLIEAAIDIICAVMICCVGSIREHFTNKWSEFFGSK